MSIGRSAILPYAKIPAMGKGILSPKSGGSYWTPRSISSKVLFWGKVSEISGGQMPNKLGSDYLTIGGSVGSYTFQAPHNATYEAADTDYIWFKTDSSQRTTTEAELIGYDLPRTPVKYDNSTPYTIREIIILKAGETLTTSEENHLRDYTDLSIWWSNVLSSHGNLKGNRGVGQSVWTPETIGIFDVDGNEYHEVVIGTQTWLLENLKTTKYNDGTPITNVTGNAAWAALTTEAYCWYNNDSATYKEPYGAMYNGYAIDSGKLAIAGYHIPTSTEWATLIALLGGAPNAGGSLKEAGTTHWAAPNTGATNISGFTALPGGMRSNATGAFSVITTFGVYWGANDSAGSKYRTYMANTDDNTVSDYQSKKWGWSVRLIKD